jgi:hypothetical protein
MTWLFVLYSQMDTDLESVRTKFIPLHDPKDDLLKRIGAKAAKRTTADGRKRKTSFKIDDTATHKIIDTAKGRHR